MTLDQGFLLSRTWETARPIWSNVFSMLEGSRSWWTARLLGPAQRALDERTALGIRRVLEPPSSAHPGKARPSATQCVTEFATLMVLLPWEPSPSRARCCLPRRHVLTRHGDRSLSKGDNFGSPTLPYHGVRTDEFRAPSSCGCLLGLRPFTRSFWVLRCVYLSFVGWVDGCGGAVGGSVDAHHPPQPRQRACRP